MLLGGMLVTAGCLGIGEDDGADDLEAGGDGADGSSSDPTTTASLDPDGNGSTPLLAKPPSWERGEWFEFTVTEELSNSQASYSTKRVVAGFEGDNYLVGMPSEAFSDEIMVLHVPGFGRVGMEDLSFEMHDNRWQPLDFPLTDGKSWQTTWQTAPVTATAFIESPTTAVIEMVGQNQFINVTYDAELGAISRIEAAGYGTVEVTDHGYNHTGIVTVPHQHDLIFFNGRIAGAVNFNQEPAPPIETLDVDSTYDRVSFAIILGTLLPDAPSGLLMERATAPDGSVYEASMVSPSGGLTVSYFSHDDPGGEWSFEHVAAGPGIVLIEGIGYHVFDVDLPSGCILPSEGEHAHGGSCPGDDGTMGEMDHSQHG